MMRVFFRAIDDFLHGRGAFAVEAPLSGRLRWLFALLAVCGVFYGAVMGTYSGLAPGRVHQLLYSGVKVPLLLLVTFLLCLPSFFVVNTIAGLRDDFGQVLRALVATQSCVTVVLAGRIARVLGGRVRGRVDTAKADDLVLRVEESERALSGLSYFRHADSLALHDQTYECETSS